MCEPSLLPFQWLWQEAWSNHLRLLSQEVLRGHLSYKEPTNQIINIRDYYFMITGILNLFGSL